MRCQEKVWRGPREGQQCRFRACRIVVGTGSGDDGMLVCGVHARTWLPRALARIAYYDPKWKGWP